MRLVEVVAVVVGAVGTIAVLLSALRTVVLPSGQFTRISRFVFALVHRLLIRSRRRDGRLNRLAPLYAPVSLVLLPFAWAMLVTVGFTLIFWGLDAGTMGDAFTTSGSSLFTLGFAKPATPGLIWLTFVEATIGLGLIALLISYLPTIYAAYSAREKAIGLLRPLTGSPPQGAELVRRIQHFQIIDSGTLWNRVTQWFSDLEQTHEAFPALASFPSQTEGDSWVNTAGAVLDAATLLLAVHRDPESGLEYVTALLHGVPALTHIAQAVGLPVDDPPTLMELAARAEVDPPPLAVSRGEFDGALDHLGTVGLAPLDADAAWRLFSHVRGAYEPALLGLAGFTKAGDAPWAGDRPARVGRPHFFSSRPLAVTWPGPAPR